MNSDSKLFIIRMKSGKMVEWSSCSTKGRNGANTLARNLRQFRFVVPFCSFYTYLFKLPNDAPLHHNCKRTVLSDLFPSCTFARLAVRWLRWHFIVHTYKPTEETSLGRIKCNQYSFSSKR